MAKGKKANVVVLAQALRKDIVQQRPLACVDAGAFHAAGAVQDEHDSFLPSCPSTILLIDTPRPSVEGVIIRLKVFADVLRPLVNLESLGSGVNECRGGGDNGQLLRKQPPIARIALGRA